MTKRNCGVEIDRLSRHGRFELGRSGAPNERKRMWRAAVAVATLLALTACQALRDLAALRSALAAEFNVTDVSVNHSTGTGGAVLTIAFPGERVAGMSETERDAFARSVGEFAASEYPRFSGLDAVVVAFRTVNKVGPVTVTRGRGSYRFPARELAGDSSGG